MARNPRQLSFFPPHTKFFGGALLRGRRITQRPLAFRKPIHIVLRSSKAKGRWAFLDYRNKRKIEKWLKTFAKRNAVRLYEVAIVWNHIHLSARFPNRSSYNCFIRSITGTLPKVVLGFQHPTQTFWDYRPFTRILEWGKDFRGTCQYIINNTLEALSLRKFQPRAERYHKWLSQHGAISPPSIPK